MSLKGVRAERRVVTVLSADIVGSTPMAERLGSEDARLILGETLARAVTVIEAYGGTVKDLAGDGVLALFGAPVAHDDDAERAARAALEITADVRRQAAEVERGWGIADFDVRIGLHTGETVVGEIGSGSRVEYGAVGDTVNTAARLQAAAKPGQVLMSSVTSRLVERVAELGPPETVALKGKAEPVLVHILAGLRTHATRRAGRSEVLVGRDRELAAAKAALGGLPGGQGGILWIVGDAGLGKSRILAELSADAERLGLSWTEGRCASYGEALPYWPVRDLLRAFFGVSVQDPDLKQRLAVRRVVDDLLPGETDVMLPYLADLLGLSADQTGVAAEALQFRTFEVVGALLAAWARRRPGVVVLDDLHWADPTSLGLVESLLGRVESEPLLVILAMRPDTSRPAWTLRERAMREYRHVSTDIELFPLDESAQQDLIGRLFAGVAVPDTIADRLAALAAGNPFYLEELVQALDTDQAVVTSSLLDIPESLEAVILARVDRLEPEWRAVLTSAAPLGRSFSLPLLEAVCERERAGVRQAVHHLRRLDLLTEEARIPHPTFRFKHALIQEAVYRSLLSEERAALHHRAAKWLTDESGARPESLYPLLAHHWSAAGDRENAMHFARLAGDQARDNHALDEAIAHYRTLVRLLDETGRGADGATALFQLGTTLLLASRYREAQEAWDRAFDLPSPAPVAPAEDVELRVLAWQLPFDRNPVHGFYATNMMLAQQLYDRLIDPIEGPAMTPGLAERWHLSDDGLVLTLTLRTGLEWNDGAPLDAEQIASGIRQSMLPAAQNADLPILLSLEGAEEWAAGRCAEDDFSGVRALDDRRLQFRLTRPAPFFPFTLMYPSVGPFRSDGIGTGPYELERMDDENVTLRRAPGYHRRRGGNVGRVTMRAVQGSEADVAFGRGEVDIFLGVPHATQYGDRMVVGAPMQSVFMMLNATAADIHLRRALAASVDRDVLARSLALTDVVATGGVVPAGVAGHTPDIAPPFDPDAARAHLARSASLASRTLLVAKSIEQYHDWWDDLVDGWRDVLGVKIEVEQRPMAENIGFRERGCHLILWHWVAGYPDADYFLRLLLHSQSSTNMGHFQSERFDALVDEASGTAGGRSGADRMALYHEADRVAVRDECAVIPLTYRRLGSLVQPGVRGWWHWGAPMQVFDTITVER